jgi:hypothetical protein
MVDVIMGGECVVYLVEWHVHPLEIGFHNTKGPGPTDVDE